MALLTIPPVTIRVATTRTNGVQVVKERMVRKSHHAVAGFGKSAADLATVLAAVDTGLMQSKVGYKKNGMVSEVFVDGNLQLKTGAFYAIYVEYGTRYMRAQPFFWPSVRIAQREFVNEMRQVFEK